MTESPYRAAAAMTQAEREVLFAHALETLRRAGIRARSLAVVPERSRLRPGSFANESLRCELEDGTNRLVFLKLSRHFRQSLDRHRGGIAYEAEVYRRLLRHHDDSSPEYLGSGEIESLGATYLLLEELEDTVRVSKVSPPLLARAAEWIGCFHAAHELVDSEPDGGFLNVYDERYYRQWSGRALRLSEPLHGEFPWLSEVCRIYEEEVVGALLAVSRTVVHGEFYPANVLVRRATIYPIDWESAAIGPGEIDLAALTEGWSPEIACACERAYRGARWGNGAPSDFQARVVAARLYLAFRWLGHGPHFATGELGRRRLRSLAKVAQSADLLADRESTG